MHASPLLRGHAQSKQTPQRLSNLGAAQFPVDSTTLNLTKMQAKGEHEANPQQTLTEKGQTPAPVAPRRGTPQGAIYSPLALEDAVRANSKEKPEVTAKPTPPMETAAETKSDESTAKAPEDDSCDDAAIIAALKSRCFDKISPYLPDGDDPPMIKVLELEYKYDIHHDPPSSNDESEEETIPPY